ncbi:MAG: hypothetical protein A3E78_10780 [Alphaproteobacteria bacterium RIFCSPHIGHO2_12_FULL_63_12]|nr:MAG: hypothetical protein A3E78_10780 [Alphaproteobacteria bacterium RIFCSPHIGHO2_12_FULL_63_12]
MAGYAAIGAAAILFTAFSIIFQDSIFRFFATPRAPFQTVAAPSAPDYAAPGSWLSRPTAPAGKEADVFYIHSTTFYRRKLWNAPIDDAAALAVQRTIALPNQAGPFQQIADIYAPSYREATLYSQFTHKYDGLAARRLAYSDIRRAFEVFLGERDPEKPLIIAGFGQGGLYAMGLLNDYFQGEINPLRRKLVAAYVIGAPAPIEALAALTPAMNVCDRPDAVRCVISYVDFEKRFDEEMERIRLRALVWTPSGSLDSIRSEHLVCVNPLSWRTDDVYQPAERNLGAASATGIADGEPPPPIPKAVGARCVDGILLVDTPKRRYLRRGDWFGAKWKPQPFNLFYYDIAENVAVRTNRLKEILKVEPEPLEPIGETVEVVDSPINKAPH